MRATDSEARASEDSERGRAYPKPGFRWQSRLGVATALFLAIGALNLAAAIVVPITLHQSGPAAAGGLVLTNEADGAFLGRSLSDVAATDPQMGAYLVTFMDTMCAFMMAFAILQIGLAWFAVRRAQPWALWAGALASLAIVPYYLAVGATFAQRGAPVLAGLGGILFFPAVAVAATAVGLSGIRRMRRSRATAE